MLFLDEPTTGLDPASRQTIWAEVRRINAGGATVFLTTQYLEEADQLCDRLAIIDEGRIVAEGTPDQLKADMGHDVVSITLTGADAAATEAAVIGLPGLERVAAECNGLALYVQNAAGSIVEIVRRLDATASRWARSASPGRRSTTSSSRPPGAASKVRPKPQIIRRCSSHDGCDPPRPARGP